MPKVRKAKESFKKSDLIDRIFEKHYFLTNKMARAAVEETLEAIVCAMASGNRVEVRGFGSFSLHLHRARKGRNPRNGEPVRVPAKYAVHYSPSADLRKTLQSVYLEELGLSD